MHHRYLQASLETSELGEVKWARLKEWKRMFSAACFCFPEVHLKRCKGVAHRQSFFPLIYWRSSVANEKWFFPRQPHQYSEIGRMPRDTDGYQQLFHTGGLCDHWKLLTGWKPPLQRTLVQGTVLCPGSLTRLCDKATGGSMCVHAEGPGCFLYAFLENALLYFSFSLFRVCGTFSEHRW